MSLPSFGVLNHNILGKIISVYHNHVKNNCLSHVQYVL